MLGKRYLNDGVPLLKLNPLQSEMLKAVNEKVKTNHYKFERVPCAVCSKENFEPMSEKGRYGEYVSIVMCKDCGLIQTNPRMDQASYNEFYNKEYRKMYVGRENPTEIFFNSQTMRGKAIFRFLMDKDIIKNPKDVFVLEVGCGAGGIIRPFRDHGCRVKGIDLGKEYIEFGREKYGLDLEENNIFNLKLDRRPNVIIYSHVFEHVLDVNKELSHISKILAPDGVVYIEVPGMRSPFTCGVDFLSLIHNSHTYHFTLTTLKNLMNKNGFQMVSGNEKIISAFRYTGSKGQDFKNDYSKSMMFWKSCELLIKFFPDPSTVVSRIKSGMRWGLKRLRLYEAIRNFYIRARYKKCFAQVDQQQF